MDLINALKRPFTDIKKLIIGVILYTLPIVSFFSSGYLLESLKLSTQCKRELPEWTNYVKLFINGLLALAIETIYFIPVLILSIISLLTIGTEKLLSFIIQDNKLNINFEQLILALESVWPIILIAILLFLFISYFIPSILISFSKNYKFEESFKFKEIFKRAFRINYFLALLIGCIIQSILFFILSYIPLIGSSIGGFIGYLIMVTLVGETCQEGINDKKENIKRKKR